MSIWSVLQPITQPQPTAGSRLAEAIGGGFTGGIQGVLESKLSALKEAEKQKQQLQLIEEMKKRGMFGKAADTGAESGAYAGTSQVPSSGMPQTDMATRMAMGTILPGAEKAFEHEEKMTQKRFEGERQYHTKFVEEYEKQIKGIREGLTKKESAANMARMAIESGDVGAFSKANLAQILNRPELATASGEVLNVAGKENLLGNLTRVSAKGQNLWFEQRLNSLFPSIGKNQTANLSIQEAIESDLVMDRAYLKKYEQLEQEDMSKYGYVRKDIQKRAYDAISGIEDKIMKRTSFRLKQLQDQEKGEHVLSSKTNKKVPKNTPLTPEMAKIFKRKYGNKSLEVAEKLGYYVPTFEEFQLFNMRPEEFRGLIQ